MKKYHSLCPIETTLNLIGNKWKNFNYSRFVARD